MSSDPLVACVIAAEETAERLDDLAAARAAVVAAAASLPASWGASCSANALFAVGELATPLRELVRAAFVCAWLARDAAPSADPDVARALDVLEAWLDGRATDAERSAIANLLARRYNGRVSPPAAWATYCACSVGLSASASAWYHAHAAASHAEFALRKAGEASPEARVAAAVRRLLTCPSAERLATAIVDESFSLP